MYTHKSVPVVVHPNPKLGGGSPCAELRVTPCSHLRVESNPDLPKEWVLLCNRRIRSAGSADCRSCRCCTGSRARGRSSEAFGGCKHVRGIKRGRELLREPIVQRNVVVRIIPLLCFDVVIIPFWA